MARPLEQLRVLDFSEGIAGAYASKMLGDAGADVIAVERSAGSPLRSWTASGKWPEAGAGEGEPGAGSPLFRFLGAGKRGAVGDPDAPEIARLLAGADVVVDDRAPDVLDPGGWREKHPSLVWLSITPFGRTGPWRDRPATEFTIQAASGSMATRGLPGGEPFQAGGRISEWFSGSVGAVAVLAALAARARTGVGEHIDLSQHEAMAIAGTNYVATMWQMLGDPEPPPEAQTVETPSIEKSSDGWVGFCTNSRQQFSDFLLLIGRPDLEEDAELQQIMGRVARLDEWQAIVRAFTEENSTDEILERAALLRIPAAPVNDGASVLRHPHLVERGVYSPLPGTPIQVPRPPWQIDGAGPESPRSASVKVEKAPQWRASGEAVGAAASADPSDALPLAGVRIVDLTAWWAGPSATQILASFGAEVIHVESARRPDGMRMVGGMLASNFDAWWEASWFFQAANAGKKGLALDLADPRGREVLLRLVAQSDAVVENFTPRVLDNFGLDFETLLAANPGLIFLRMPAFGLSGPWRDHPGFAQTMEQLSGLAWVTGHRDDQPRIQRGPCDPLAGMHAAFSFFLARIEREKKGGGVLVESTMVEAALNAAAELVLEASAHGVSLERDGNRSPGAAPQGLFACADDGPAWLAISVTTDAHWRGLVAALGWSEAGLPAGWQDAAGRKADEASIEERLRAACASEPRAALLERLHAAGVPAEPLADPRRLHHQAHLRARRFFERIEHPVTGDALVAGQAFRFASRDANEAGWLRGPAPRLGEHNIEVLRDVAGLTDEEIEVLLDADLIGSVPTGV